MLLEDLDAGATVPRAHVLNKLSAITNEFTLEGVDKGARAVIEAVRATNLVSWKERDFVIRN